MSVENTYEMAQWSETMMESNKARANREIALDESGVLAWEVAEKSAVQPNSGLRVRYNAGTAEFVPVQGAMKAVETASNSLYSWVVPEAPEGLDKLTDFEAVEAERKINAGGSETSKRAQAIASMLGVETSKLTGYVLSLMRRVPQVNRWDYRQDLEQSIWSHLTHRKGSIVGNWGLVKLEAQVAYKRWYSVYSGEAQLALEAERRAISLERAYARDQQSESDHVGADIPDVAWVGWESALESNLDGLKAFSALPERIQGIVERKANGTPISRLERNQLSKWLAGGPSKRNPDVPTNKEVLANVLAGTHKGPIVWSKPARK